MKRISILITLMFAAVGVGQDVQRTDGRTAVLLPRLRASVPVDARAPANCERPARSRRQTPACRSRTSLGFVGVRDVRSEVRLGSR